MALAALLDGKYDRPFEHWVRNRVMRYNKNFMGAFVGDTGSSKSWSAISLAASIDPKFNVDRIAMSAQEVVKLVTSGKLKKGSAIILDEAGVNYSNKNWMKMRNKAMGELVQTFRFMNLVMFHTLPSFNFLDATQRFLVHFGFDSCGIRYNEKEALFRPRQFIHDPFRRDYDYGFHFTYPIIRMPNGRYYRVKMLRVQLADKRLLMDYEVKKREWNKELQKKIYKRVVMGISEKDEEERAKQEKKLLTRYQLDASMMEIANKVKKNLEDYLKKFRGKRGWDIDEVQIRADYTNLKSIDAVRIARYLRRLDEIKEYLMYKNEVDKSNANIERLKDM